MRRYRGEPSQSESKRQRKRQRGRGRIEFTGALKPAPTNTLSQIHTRNPLPEPFLAAWHSAISSNRILFASEFKCAAIAAERSSAAARP